MEEEPLNNDNDNDNININSIDSDKSNELSHENIENPSPIFIPKKKTPVTYYLPFGVSDIPDVLPPSLNSILPWELKEHNELERKKKRKHRKELEKIKKHSLLDVVENCVSTFANATVDAISVISEDVMDSQAHGASIRFTKIFAPFVRFEKFYGEYKSKLITSPEASYKGYCYISTSFFSFYLKKHEKTTTIMLPIKGIVCIRKANKKYAYCIPPYSPGQFVILGNSLNEDSVFNSIIIYTQDHMQHIFYDCKYIEELFTVLDYVWRNDNPEYLSDTIPYYVDPNFIAKSLNKQLEARKQLLEYRKKIQSSHVHHSKNYYDFCNNINIDEISSDSDESSN